ncbi:MAG: CRISPR-associated RAMP Cmr4 [uncultured Sulfurovum sp.]|uniref:CRISPR-associated RAMP Cmr4 n=1 Tax=uncultured Sulfurovum sp. TaxID=269237 RepID=A0A6S6T9E8_9BACT|nr:MAG: CRISPR-associated RAMP Cmr4 [uncultured Sulfurovum sp.]
MYKNRLYLIENKTSLHVGSGDANFGVIDKQIQRDAITEYPTIHSSSLKGALREYIMHKLECPIKRDKDKDEKYTEEEQSRYNQVAHIFGDDEQSGKVRFIDAHLLSIPMRSDLNPYYHCVSPKSIELLVDFADTFGLTLEDKEALTALANYSDDALLVSKESPVIEDFQATSNESYDLSVLEGIVGSPVALVPNKKYAELLKNLPIIARNQLENGESKNLFYEEVLPRKSKFFTVISEPTYLNFDDKDRLEKAFEKFATYLMDNDTIHIGANASIGYGVCKFKEL